MLRSQVQPKEAAWLYFSTADNKENLYRPSLLSVGTCHSSDVLECIGKGTLGTSNRFTERDKI